MSGLRATLAERRSIREGPTALLSDANVGRTLLRGKLSVALGADAFAVCVSVFFCIDTGVRVEVVDDADERMRGVCERRSGLAM